MSERILVVDDEAVLRNNLLRFLRRTGHQVEGVDSGEAALEKMAVEDYAVLITDLKMPGMGGEALLERVTAQHPQTMIMVITAYASIDSAISALRSGAQDYLLKPLSLDEVRQKIERLLHYRSLEQRVQRLRRELHQRFETDDIVAVSTSMKAVMRLVEKVAVSRSSVLIEGESGTGKELIARALHDASPWSEKDFIAVNLAAQPADLVDATLFGHKRGAYTGANRRREGVFRAVNGGTVFLDEISELPLEVQVKLLRVLENREVLPLGADRPEPVDFRLVAATNRPLREMVREGAFRQDLFFRIDVLRIELPPLRDRPRDISPLIQRFLRLHAANLGRTAPQLTHEAARLLQRYSWPGNVRELSNVIERAVLLCDDDWIAPSDLSANLQTGRDQQTPLEFKTAVADFERKHIQRVLEQCDGDKNQAAELLGVHLATLYRYIERLGLS